METLTEAEEDPPGKIEEGDGDEHEAEGPQQITEREKPDLPRRLRWQGRPVPAAQEAKRQCEARAELQGADVPQDEGEPGFDRRARALPAQEPQGHH